jgi:hypothetical protein
MIYFASVADNHTGKFMGAVVVNRETDQAAFQAVVEIVEAAKIPGHKCFEVMLNRCPATSMPLPPMDRLLSRQFLVKHYEAHGGVASVTTDKDGNIERVH